MSAADTRVYVNGNRVNEEILMHNDRTYIPLRAVSEALGANVAWDAAANSAFVSFNEDDAYHTDARLWRRLKVL